MPDLTLARKVLQTEAAAVLALVDRVAGLPFRIEVMNMDKSENAVYSDMPDYYKYFASSTGTEFELTPVVDEAAGQTVGSGVNQQEFCHPIVVGWPPIE